MKNKKSSSKKQPAAPAPPAKENSYYQVNGQTQSSTVFDPAKGGFVTNVTQTPQEQAIEGQSNQFISDLLPKVNSIMGQDMSSYENAFRAPQEAALNESYNKASGQAMDMAGSRGTNVSSGFEKYRVNNIERNRAQGMADIAANAKLAGPEMMRSMLAPYADAMNMYSAALSGEQGNQFSNAGLSTQGSQLGNNINNQYYQNQMGAYQAKLASQPPPRQKIFGIF